MEEVIAKSKAARAAKIQQREEDLHATEALDADLDNLLQCGALAQLFKAKGARNDRAAKRTAAEEQGADEKDYDIVRRELAFEARAQVWVQHHVSNVAESLQPFANADVRE
jgi:hypothetical protein